MAQEISLVGLEPTVFKILQDYLKSNKPFDMLEIIPYLVEKMARLSINTNSEGVKQVLVSLLKKKFIFKGTTLTREDVLTTLKRKEIFDYIRSNPGTHFIKIMNSLNLSNTVVTWHLDILEKFGYIKREIVDNREIYFDPVLDVNQVKIRYYGTKEKSKKILYYLMNNDDGLTKTELLNATAFHSNTLTKYLEALESLKIIVVIKKSDTILYTFNKKYSSILI